MLKQFITILKKTKKYEFRNHWFKNRDLHWLMHNQGVSVETYRVDRILEVILNEVYKSVDPKQLTNRLKVLVSIYKFWYSTVLILAMLALEVCAIFLCDRLEISIIWAILACSPAVLFGSIKLIKYSSWLNEINSLFNLVPEFEVNSKIPISIKNGKVVDQSLDFSDENLFQ